jgi:hypothetical protein
MEVDHHSHTQVPVPHGKQSPVPKKWDTGWAKDPVWIFRRQEKLLTPGGIRTPDFLAHSPLTLLTPYHLKHVLYLNLYIADVVPHHMPVFSPVRRSYWKLQLWNYEPVPGNFAVQSI